MGRDDIGKDARPAEVMCWADTYRKIIEAEDKAIGLAKYASSAVGQLAGNWSCRGSMDLRDESL